MRLAAGGAIFVLGGAGLLIAGPYDDGDEWFVALLSILIPLLAGVVVARWRAVGLSLLTIVPGIVLVESSSGELTKATLYADLVAAIVVTAALLALGAWVGATLERRRSKASAV